MPLSGRNGHCIFKHHFLELCERYWRYIGGTLHIEHIWGFPEMGYPKIDGLEWKIPRKLMIWGYLYFRKPPISHHRTITSSPALALVSAAHPHRSRHGRHFSQPFRPSVGRRTARSLGGSWKRGTPKWSTLMGFSTIKHPFGGTPFMETLKLTNEEFEVFRDLRFETFCGVLIVTCLNG